jgi:hypothetical protein
VQSVSFDADMKQLFLKFIKFPFYFALFSLYPVLALIAYNIGELRFRQGLRALVISFLAALVLFLLFWLLFKSKQRAALETTFLLLLFYGYGHVYNLILKRWSISNLSTWMLGVWVVFGVVVTGWLARRRTRVRKAAPILNIVALGLVITATVQTILWSRSVSRPVANEQVQVPVLSLPEGQTPPDVYYIIMDSYGREDTLKAAYGFDNSAFVDSLEQMGFYVAPCSQSNYARTDFSMASSLNLSYVPDLNSKFTPDFRDPYPIWRLLQHSAVRAALENAGYKTVALATGFAWSQLEDADVYLEPPLLLAHPNEFEALLFQTTMIRAAQNVDDSQRLAAWDQFRQRTLFSFDELAKLGSMPGPKFVFAHIIAPHPPFVFGANGEAINPAEYISPTGSYTGKDYQRGYVQALPFINRELERVLPQIIEKSSVPPIIILQGDHGAWALGYPQRIQNLNAYYLPGHTDALYPSISPVNSFRVVFNNYFGTDYPLLKDESFSAPVKDIYKFAPVAYPCKK